MPAIVDHDLRRQELSAIAARLIAESGVDAATVRAIAEAAGASTKVVSHYFADKRALLVSTYRWCAERSAAMAGAAALGSDAADYACALLPTTPEGVENWRVWLAFFGHAAADQGFAALQRAQVARATLAMAAVLARDRRFASMSDPDRRRLARDLLALMMGVALQAAFDPSSWPPTAQRRTIGAALARATPAEAEGGL